MILLLAPAPFVLRDVIPDLVSRVRALGIREFGPIKFTEQQQIVTPLADLPSLPAYLFAYFDRYFVPRTRQILIWLAMQGIHLGKKEALRDVPGLFRISCLRSGSRRPEASWSAP
jgi:hypothetical protein